MMNGVALEIRSAADGVTRPFAQTLCAERVAVRQLMYLAVLPIAALVAVHVVSFRHSEPIFYGDENRHVMTSVFFRDLLADRPFVDARRYVENYYVQYPALGLLIWPPLFHAMIGVVMFVAGTSSLVATLMVGLSAAIACIYLFRLVARTHNQTTASAAVLLFGSCPLVFEYSRHVMLEMPTMMWGLIATFHYARFLDELRRRDVMIAAFASACAALTRFDAMYLLPLFGILLAARKQLHMLKRGDVWIAAAGALLMVLPYYGLVATQVGGLHLRQASESVMPGDSGFLAAGNLLYYPKHVPTQVSWCVAIAALLGMIRLRDADVRRRCLPYLAILLATYLTFTPLAEMDFRHTIYWIPAVVMFAIEGATLLATVIRCPQFVTAAIVVLAITTAITSLAKEQTSVHGYAAAARYVSEHSSAGRGRFCLFDGWWDGNFTYQLRHVDPQRRLGVLRGDKLFYGFVCVPETNFTEYAANEREILDILDRHAPEFVVVEEPQLMRPIPTAERLRRLLREHPEQFTLEQSIPVRGGRLVRDFELKIYRNLKARDASADVEFEVLGLNRSVGTHREKP